MNKEQIKKFKLLLIVSILWWIAYAIFSADGGFDISYTQCQNQICTVVQKSWFGWGKEKNSVTFEQNKADKLQMRKSTNSRTPHYYFSLNGEFVSGCSNCEKMNNIRLPVDFYRHSSAERYFSEISSGQDFDKKDINLLFEHMALIWGIAIFLSGLLIIFKI